MKRSIDQLVLLGTGTPNADPTRAGPALAVVVGGRPYLVDAGPGIVRRAAAACAAGIAALAPPHLDSLFLTHLHSDHTAGLPDLILTPWVLGRARPLRLFGPAGTGAMARHLQRAYAEDVRERLEGLEPANPTGHEVEVEEIVPGPVFEDDRVRISAFSANHGSWPALGFRFESEARTVVVSGDTAPYPAMAENYAGCDVLVHEVYSDAGLQTRSADWRAYHANVHTSAAQLAELASQVRPKLLVLTHQLWWGASEAQLLAEVRAGYDGKVASGRDLDVF